MVAICNSYLCKLCIVFDFHYLCSRITRIWQHSMKERERKKKRFEMILKSATIIQYTIKGRFMSR